MSTSRSSSSGMASPSLAIVPFTGLPSPNSLLSNLGEEIPAVSRAQSPDLSLPSGSSPAVAQTGFTPSKGPKSTPGESSSRGPKPSSKKSDPTPRSPHFIPSRVTDDIPVHLRLAYGIPDDHLLFVPPEEQRPNTIPSPRLAFFSAQLTAGLRFPIPPFFASLSNLYHIPLNQFAPNAIRMMVSYYILFSHLGLDLNPLIFVSLFTAKKGSDETFYLSTKGPAKFLQKAPSSNKHWKEEYFLVLPPGGRWPFPTQWVSSLPLQEPTPLVEPRVLDGILERVRGCSCDLTLLPQEDYLLFQHGLSPLRVVCPRDLGNLLFASRALFG